MEPLAAYFWFLGVPVGLWLTWKVWTTLKEAKDEGVLDEPSTLRFTRVFGCLFTIPYVFLGAFQLLGGYDRPEYPSAFALNQPYAFAGWVVIVGWSLLAITWFWLGDPAVVLSRLGPRLNWLPSNTFLIRMIVTALGAVNIAVWTFWPPKIP